MIVPPPPTYSGDYAEVREAEWEATASVEIAGRRTVRRYSSSRPPRRKETMSERTFQPFLQAVLDRISELGRLAPNWDGEGASSISPTAVRAATDLLGEVQDSFYARAGERITPFAVAPLSDGGIQMEWRGTSVDTEIEIGPNSEWGFLLVEGKGPGRRFSEGDGVSKPQVLFLVSRSLGV